MPRRNGRASAPSTPQGLTKQVTPPKSKPAPNPGDGRPYTHPQVIAPAAPARAGGRAKPLDRKVPVKVDTTRALKESVASPDPNGPVRGA